MIDLVIGDTPEKLCHKCGEHWPATDEFFYRSTRNRSNFRSPCKACIDEKRRETGAVKPCCIPGCNKPRYHWRYARCYEHRQYATKRQERGAK